MDAFKITPTNGGADADGSPIASGDTEIAYVMGGTRRPVLTRIDIIPFLVLHAVALNHYMNNEDPNNLLPAIGVLAAFGAHALALLFQVWLVSFRFRVQFTQVPSSGIRGAQVLYVCSSRTGTGKDAIVPLHVDANAQAPLPGREGGRGGNDASNMDARQLAKEWLTVHPITFEYQSVRFQIVEPSTPAASHSVQKLPALDACPLAHYSAWCRAGGWRTDAAASTRAKWGPNVIETPSPTFAALMAEHVVAPFFVFQVACVCMWMLDEYWYYSLFTLFTLISMEMVLVAQRLKQHSALRAMRPQPHPRWVCRGGRWAMMAAADMVPGDLISLTREVLALPAAGSTTSQASAATSTQTASVCPADVLLLRGTVVANEAMLTGENTPCVKDALAADAQAHQAGMRLNAFNTSGSRSHSKHIVYGGTSILQGDSGSDSESDGHASLGVPAPPDNGVIGVVVRTGPWSSQGELMRNIVHASTRTSAGNKEAFVFIFALLIFAIASAAYVVQHAWDDPMRSRPKLVLHCVMIITSVVPPELPVELSLAVNASLAALVRVGIFCTDPFRITLAGKVETAAFDKTGTLTSDQFKVKGLVLPSVAGAGATDGAAPTLTSLDAIPLASLHVLVGCHELVMISKRIKVPNPAAPAQPNLPRLPFGAPPRPAAQITPQFIEKDVTELVGDPLERATLEALRWTCADPTSTAGRARWAPQRPAAPGATSATTTNGAHAVHPHSGHAVEVLKVWAFSSAARRMACAIRVTVPATSAPRVARGLDDAAAQLEEAGRSATEQIRIVMKGAPETIQCLLASVPPAYHATQEALMLTGARVLALAYRVLPKEVNAAAVKRWSLAEAEAGGLVFAGFLVLAAPLKTDTRRTIRELQQSQHRTVMITGDSALTAVSVAVEAGMIDPAEGAGVWLLEADDVTGAPQQGNLHWNVLKRAGDAFARVHAKLPLDTAAVEARMQPPPSDRICVTGAALRLLQQLGMQTVQDALLPRADIFARVAPEQKELVITTLNRAGRWTLMCGDGTNDMGALKHAHVGVSILSNVALEVKYDMMRLKQRTQPRPGAPGARGTVAVPSTAQLTDSDDEIEALLKSERSVAQPPPTPPTTAAATTPDGKPNLQGLLAQRLAELENEAGNDAMGGPPSVALGDASMASPFTSKLPTPAAVLDILRQGRCTLVTTHQMFKILGINSLILSYMLSVLYLHGVKSGDTQATIGGMMVAALFLSLSWAKPVKRLAPQRPHTSVFNRSLVLSVVLQAAVHVGCMMYAVKLCEPFYEADLAATMSATAAELAAERAEAAAIAAAAPGADTVQSAMAALAARGAAEQVVAATAPTGPILLDDRKFAPNVINTVVFLLSNTQQACTFLTNYAGLPFMQPLRENTLLLRAAVVAYAACILGTLGISEDLNAWLEIIPLPTWELRMSLLGLMAIDAAACLLIRALVR